MYLNRNRQLIESRVPDSQLLKAKFRRKTLEKMARQMFHSESDSVRDKYMQEVGASPGSPADMAVSAQPQPGLAQARQMSKMEPETV